MTDRNTDPLYTYLDAQYGRFLKTCPPLPKDRRKLLEGLQTGKGVDAVMVDKFLEWYRCEMAKESVTAYSLVQDFDMELEQAEAAYGLAEHPNARSLVSHYWTQIILGRRSKPKNPLRIMQNFTLLIFQDGTVDSQVSISHAELLEEPLTDAAISRILLNQSGMALNQLLLESIDDIYERQKDRGQYFRDEVVIKLKYIVEAAIAELRKNPETDKAMTDDVEKLNQHYFSLFHNEIPDKLRREYRTQETLRDLQPKNIEQGPRPSGGF